MKIRHKLTIRYTGVTAIIFSLIVLSVYFFSEHSRENEFYRGLTREAVTKVNLFLTGHVDAETMQSIYLNNRQFIDEVEVAVYTPNFDLLYHDAQDIDIVKETPELIKATIQNKELQFYEGNYQVVAMLYAFKGNDYIVTAAAYDGHGYTKLENLTTLLFILWIAGVIILAIFGYFMAKGALQPVSRIVGKVGAITDSCLDTRLAVKKEHDELDELSETFNQMLNRLEQSFNNQKLFVSNVAHELRTPLTSLIAELEVVLLFEQRTTEEYKTVITNTLTDAQNLKHLITGLLDLAKVNYDATQISKEDLRLDELLLDAREIVLKANSDYTVNLIFEQNIEDENTITVKGNEYLLKTAFVNLIENNCKFSDNKTSHVNISFSEKKSIIHFSDCGIGIPQDEIDKIFIPFYRGTNSSQTKGQGLGMALTQKIVLLHNGTALVHSHIGEGTRFVIEIPHI